MSKKELIELADKLQELYLVAEGDSEVLFLPSDLSARLDRRLSDVKQILGSER